MAADPAALPLRLLPTTVEVVVVQAGAGQHENANRQSPQSALS